MQTKITAIVLAAGMSTRMGKQNKLLLPIGDRTMIEKTVDTLLASQVHELIVVLGHEKEVVKKSIGDRKVIFVENSEYKSGMTSSIQFGVRGASPAATGYMICLSDMPLLASSDMDMLVATFAEKGDSPCILIPVYQGKRGNPVIFSTSFKESILQHKEPNGCKAIVKRNSHLIIEVEMPNENVLRDVDTEDDYDNFD